MPTTKELLLTQYAACYNEENWFKPLTDVIKDLTEEEFKWKESEELHSIRQLVIHLTFWNERYLYRFKGTPLTDSPDFSKGDPTFDDSDLSKEELLKRFYDIMDDFHNEIKSAPEEKFEEQLFADNAKRGLWWETIHNINIHNAYHLGQMMLIKKQMKLKK